MATPQEHLLDWLRDAHAMEQQAEKMLRAQSERLEHYPKLKTRIDQHLVVVKFFRTPKSVITQAAWRSY
jgi:ferritin-like metal-binding protein YciE